MKKVIAVLLVIISIFSLSACNAKKNANKVVEFSDFTVERCVRQQLDKDWDEDITVKELEDVTELCILTTYDCTFGGEDAIYQNGNFSYGSYLDLCDLEYLTNLKELKIGLSYYDTVVNVDAIKNCKKLEELYMPASMVCYSKTPGYKYLKDIISELPNLEYVDFGMYFDDHMEEVVLSESKNDDLEICSESFSTFYGSYRSYEYISDDELKNYDKKWNFKYKSMRSQDLSDCDLFPVISASNMSDLSEKLNKISKDTEDIIIFFDGGEERYYSELDFSVFEEFDNLVTLSVVGCSFKLDYEIKDFMKEVKGYVGTSAVNLDSLDKLDNLQVLNLSGFVGDISDISTINTLRELSIVSSAVDSVDFIGELKSVKELILNIYNYEDQEELCLDIDKAVSKLGNLKYYFDGSNIGSDDIDGLYTDICDMKSLETLVVYNGDDLENIVDSDTIKYLTVIDSNDTSWKNISFQKMKSLESLSLHTNDIDSAMEVDYDSIVELPNIKFIVYPVGVLRNCIDNGSEYVFPVKLAEKIADNENISAFCWKGPYDYDYSIKRYTDIEFSKILYENGIEDMICQSFIRSGWQGGYDYTFQDYQEYWKELKEY